MRVSLMAVVRLLDANLTLVEPSGGREPAVNRSGVRLSLIKPGLEGPMATTRCSAEPGSLLDAIAERISSLGRLYGA